MLQAAVHSLPAQLCTVCPAFVQDSNTQLGTREITDCCPCFIVCNHPLTYDFSKATWHLQHLIPSVA